MPDIQTGPMGFDRARHLMWCFDIRSTVYRTLAATTFLDNELIVAVFIDAYSRADRVHLTAFNAAGNQLDTDTVYTDDEHSRPQIVPEFDHEFTGLATTVPTETDLGQVGEDGWVIDMRAVRAYNIDADRAATQRACFLAHLADMVNSGEVHHFLDLELGSESDSDPGEQTGAA